MDATTTARVMANLHASYKVRYARRRALSKRAIGFYRLANELAWLAKAEDESHEDIDRIEGVPGEIHGDVSRGYERDRALLFVRYCLDPDTFALMLAETTTEKFAHYFPCY
jgi:hypothetical protein